MSNLNQGSINRGRGVFAALILMAGMLGQAPEARAGVIHFGTSPAPPLAFNPNNTYIHITGGPNSFAIPGTAYTNSRMGIFFTLPGTGTYTVESLTAPLRTSGGDEQLTFEIFNVLSNAATGPALGSATGLVGRSTSYSLFEFSFSPGTVLAGGVEYILVGSIPVQSTRLQQVDWAGNSTGAVVPYRTFIRYFNSSGQEFMQASTARTNATNGPAWLLRLNDAALAEVPEPGTVALMGVGLAGLLLARRRRL